MNATSGSLSLTYKQVGEETAPLAFRIATPAEFWGRAVRPAWVLIVIATIILLAGTVLGPFSYAPLHITIARLSIVGSFALGVALFRANDRQRSALMMEAFALSMAIGLTVPGITSMIAALNVPYQDANLLALDRALGLDWNAIVLALRNHQTPSLILSYCYSSLLWQPVFLFPILAYVDPERLRRILAASAIALFVTVIIFIFVPAKTGYVHLGYERSDFPNIHVNTSWGVFEILEDIRRGSRQLSLEGLVTFPSYHACAAVLLAYGWWALPILRYPFVILNVVMFVACVPIGSHYIVDVLAGFFLALTTFFVADRYFEKTDPHPPLAPWLASPQHRSDI